MDIAALGKTPLNLIEDTYDYWIDTFQRSVLFVDVIRKRGNAYLDHLKLGQPPVLVFDYTVISDGRLRARPVNYQLVKIKDRREKGSAAQGPVPEQRGPQTHTQKSEPDPRKRPIVVIDPRAGHGPGIGGSKMDSQIGVALNAGHPVYFVLFFTEPMPGQTIADVQQCEVHFLEEVATRHPEAPKPAIIGNCQAGWAAALIGADRPDVTGPMVFNGSPLSYWGGVRGANPMRYRGGLFGGSWLASLGSDLGNGTFDGANLVAGFEELNPANTFWDKQAALYRKIDTEEQRYLDFEKWWGGFFLLSKEEISFIVRHLFVSDELEQGFLKLQKGRYINLKDFKEPIVVFASQGDNITPPQQALNWITRVYKSVDEIKRSGQVIVYLIHDSIGHLGIFVSSKVNRREHTRIIGCVDYIEYLTPGLYEMVIREGPSKPWLNDHEVDFEERDFSDIMALDDGHEDEDAFQAVSSVSKVNDKIYQDFISPWVRFWSCEASADWIRQLHPLRMQRYTLSDMNPLLWPFGILGGMVKKGRLPAAEDNLFTAIETCISGWISQSLELYRKTRDDFHETLFYTIYGNEWTRLLFFDPDRNQGHARHAIGPEKSNLFREVEAAVWQSAMKKGGFEEAVVRIIIAVTSADRSFGMREFDAARSVMKTDERLRRIDLQTLRTIILDQAALLEKDINLALGSLRDLLPGPDDRKAAVAIAHAIANADSHVCPGEFCLLDEIETILTDEEHGHA